MLIKSLHKAETWFNAMVFNYSSKDAITAHNLKLKHHHSLVTQKNASLLSAEIGLSDDETIIAQLVGLLHDCGRFPQFYHYGTFRDNLSRDHAKWAVEIIESENLLENLTSLEQEWILEAIYYHNEYQLPSQLKQKNEVFCKLIRDVDKLDIFRIMLENQYILDHKPQGDPSSKVLNSILRKECVLYEDVINETDFKLLQLSWIFDLNFKWSRQNLLESKLLHRLAATIPFFDGVENIKRLVISSLEDYF